MRKPREETWGGGRDPYGDRDVAPPAWVGDDPLLPTLAPAPSPLDSQSRLLTSV